MDHDTFRARAEGAGDLEKAMSILGADRLSKYRELVGITDVIELGPRATRRPAPNIGLVSHVCWAIINSFMPCLDRKAQLAHDTRLSA